MELGLGLDIAKVSRGDGRMLRQKDAETEECVEEERQRGYVFKIPHIRGMIKLI